MTAHCDRSEWDVCIVGAGAAGLFCAGLAGQMGLKVLLIDHASRVAEKVRISGGGRCNFTNRDLDLAQPEKHFISENPRFCRSALKRYTPQDFIGLIERHGIAWHEKHKGQLFCDDSSESIIRMLLAECEAAGVTRWQPCKVHRIEKRVSDEKSATRRRQMDDFSYEINSDRGVVLCRAVVIATGGLSIPKIGASDFGYRIAQQFGHRIVPTRAALVPLTFDEAQWQRFIPLAGLSLPVRIETGAKKARMAFDEDLLFTHRGLSGPAVLQISSYWSEGNALQLDLAPREDLCAALRDAKAKSRKLLANELAAYIPSRLAETLCAQKPEWQRECVQTSDKALAAITDALHRWQITPNGTEGYKKAEVTAGGVDTRELSSQTLESKQSPGLYFIGEVVDVTGWLGGYNFQWAWASAHACAHGLLAQIRAREVASL